MMPLRKLPAGLAQNAQSYRNDQARGFAQRNKIVGGYESALRMVPADQRLEASKSDGFKIDYRLIVDLELVAANSESQPCQRNCKIIFVLRKPRKWIWFQAVFQSSSDGMYSIVTSVFGL